MPAHTKVPNLHDHAVADEDVCWLDIPMQNGRASAMQVQETPGNAAHERQQLDKVLSALLLICRSPRWCKGCLAATAAAPSVVTSTVLKVMRCTRQG